MFAGVRRRRLVVVCYVYLFFLSCQAALLDNPADRLALSDLAAATGGGSWVRSGGWLENDTSVCDWDLVGCDGAARVKLLTLSFNGLSGSLPASISNLTHLQDLDLEYNALAGAVPETLGQLPALKQLGLGGNAFTGGLPESICSVLVAVTNNGTLEVPACDLFGSAFSCPLPCPELTESLCGATCVEGGMENEREGSRMVERTAAALRSRGEALPSSSSSSSSSSSCVGASSHLPPAECDAWRSIFDGLDLANSSASLSPDGASRSCSRDDPCGCVGGDVSDSPSDDYDDDDDGPCASGNGTTYITGVCCQDSDVVDNGLLSAAAAVTKIILHGTDATGPIPSELAAFSRLTVLDLDHNSMAGTIPDSLAALTELEELYLGGRGMRLAGPLPAWLADLPRLRYLDVDSDWSYAQLDDGPLLSGTVPASLAGLPLVDLKLPYGALSGSLPPFDFARQFSASDCGWRTCCDLSGNDFACPLPPGAAGVCNATCK